MSYGFGDIPRGFLPAGSVVYWQGTAEPAIRFVGRLNTIAEEMRRAILATGAFDWVQVSVTGFFDPYFSIKARTSSDRADAMDPLAQIQQGLDSITGALSVIEYYQADSAFGYGIDSIPTRPAGSPAQAGQTTASPTVIAQQAAYSGGNGGGGNSSNLLDELADSFGLDRKYSFAVGVGAALLGVILISKLSR